MSKGYINTTDRRFIAEMERYYSHNGSLHWSHRTWIARQLTEAGKSVPEGDKELLAAVKG